MRQALCVAVAFATACGDWKLSEAGMSREEAHKLARESQCMTCTVYVDASIFTYVVIVDETSNTVVVTFGGDTMRASQTWPLDSDEGLHGVIELSYKRSIVDGKLAVRSDRGTRPLSVNVEFRTPNALPMPLFNVSRCGIDYR